MNNELKFEYIKRNWELRDGIVYSRRTGKPISFSNKTGNGRHFQSVNIDGKYHAILLPEAVFMLFYDRAIAEGKEIHHVDNDPGNNAIINLAELTRKQHMRIHKYQANDPMRGIDLNHGAWQFRWLDDDGRQRSRAFHGINEAMAFRDEIERPRRQELRALGLNCKRAGNRLTSAVIRKLNKRDRLGYRCRH